ncbi:hypothetical protein MMC26_001799 [Xylographa opegraphella]|nr:hypothetical protein [Xylographa opegraphella]
MTDTQQWHSDLQSRLVAEGYPLGLADMAEPFSGLGAGSWASTRPITADCEAAISHLAIESWFISRTGVTLLAPKLETDGHCTLGIYLTSPLDPETGDIRPYGRAQGSDINIVHEATKLVSKIEIQQEGGAYVDLQNGLELCLYDQSLIDPTNICARMTKMRLRDCLDNRAAASRGRMVMAAGSRIATTNTGMTSTVASTLAATTPAIARSPQILPGH